MRWVAPTEKDTANQTLEKRLWAAADQFRANIHSAPAPAAQPVLVLLMLAGHESLAGGSAICTLAEFLICP